MEIDPVFQKELVATFKDELEERLQVITEGLLYLEKNDQQDEVYANTIDAIFRAAHNIKGAARAIGVKTVGDISHQMESLFTSIQKHQVEINKDIIDLCLEAVDSMRTDMAAFIEDKPSNVDIQNLLSRLQLNKSDIKKVTSGNNINKKKGNDRKIVKNEYESVRVSLSSIDRVSVLVEEIQVNKIAIEDHFVYLSKVVNKLEQFSCSWKEILLAVNSHYQNETHVSLQKLLNANNDILIELNNSIQQIHKNFRNKINELSILSTSMQEEVGMLRLVPASNLLRGFLRSSRDLASSLGKQIQLTIQGDEVKMDKMILDSLKDPLTHILRNAIDHGIEDSAKRLNMGKSEIGHITIAVKEEDNQIYFDINDDGAGIDVNLIAKIAENKYLVPPSELKNMTEEEILNLIFVPRFSTKDIITDVSGRGIGLDVVRANIEDLKGTVMVASCLGQGTTFTLRVPLVVASELGLTVSCAGQDFVIPMSGIERVLALSTDDIVAIEATQAVLLDGHPIPLRILSNILQFDKNESVNPSYLPIIVLKKGRKIVALLVDEIIGKREIVIKPLQAPAVNIPCVIGGTLSSKGQVIIVLSPGDLIEKAFHENQLNRILTKDKTAKQEAKPHILVVDDSITTRTLEKTILESNHYEVTVAVNGKEAWDILQNKSFSLLITDISMPIMDGFALTERVKQSRQLHDMPVIIVTSLGSQAEKKRGVEVGADAYIVKNEFKSDELLEIVSQLV